MATSAVLGKQYDLDGWLRIGLARSLNPEMLERVGKVAWSIAWSIDEVNNQIIVSVGRKTDRELLQFVVRRTARYAEGNIRDLGQAFPPDPKDQAKLILFLS